MHILKYYYHGPKDEAWEFSSPFLRKINLIVGDTGTGKTRFLNTIFNLGKSVVAKEISTRGIWDILFNIGNQEYEWHFTTDFNSKKKIIVKKDLLCIKDNEGNKRTIVERDENKFKYQDKELPRLPHYVSSVSLLQDEDDIKPIYSGFSTIMRRKFFTDELDKSFRIEAMPIDFLEHIKKQKNLTDLFYSELSVNIKLAILQEFFTKIYEEIKTKLLDVFEFIEDASILEINKLRTDIKFPFYAPVFCIKERNVKEYITSDQMSSGMQKVLLLLLDSFLIPEGGIFLIDEYENSLGLSAIDFLPDFLTETDLNNQFFITSHHPYIINNIPIENWLVFHRKGLQVKIKSGTELKETFGKSKQKYFLQLVNDPFYKEGIE